jgi:hypothetical protein
MPIPSIYLNLEDDVSKIVQRIKREKAQSLVLVCPKRCFLFNDSINLRLLKKQVDMLGKEVYILTMDELGQMYAKEAGFQLKFLPKSTGSSGISDIRSTRPQVAPVPEQKLEKPVVNEKPKQISESLASTVSQTVAGIKSFVHKPAPTVQSNTAAFQEPASKPEPELEIQESVYPVGIDESAETEKKHSAKYKKLILGLVCASLLLVVALVFVVLPKASVAVYPKTEPVTRDWDVTISSNVQQPDASAMILPSTAINQTLEEKNKFQSQGKQQVGNKATGTVQIYNFTKLPLNLKAGTTILTLGSQHYMLTQDLSGIRPTTYSNASTKEVDQNSLTPPVEVVAENGGEDYNVPAGTRLEVTNQVFGSKPQILFAKTVDPITGGTSRFLSKVTSQDVTSAQNALADQALSELKSKIASQNLILPDKSYTLESLGFTTDQPVGAESPNFNADLKVKVTGLAFSMADLQKLIKDRINQTLNSNETVQIQDPAHQIGYTLKNIDMTSGVATIGVHFEGNAVMNINLDDITSELVNKNSTQVNDILLSKAAIDKVEITLAPTWQKTFPFFASKIHVYVVK